MIRSGADSLRRYASLCSVRVDGRTGVATVGMRNPPVNVMDSALLESLSETVRTLTEDRARGMILTSSVPDVFSAGLRIDEFISGDKERFMKYWYAFQDSFLDLYGAKFPTAAAITGHAPAGGCCLSLCCEYRVMVGGHYRIGLNETLLGIVAPPFLVDMFRNTVSCRRAEIALTTGKLYTVQEARKIGLIDRVAKDGADAVSDCEEFVDKFSKISSLARRSATDTVRGKALSRLKETREQCFDKMWAQVSTPEVRAIIEAYKASIDKKKNDKA